jgi:hypothetical protein
MDQLETFKHGSNLKTGILEEDISRIDYPIFDTFGQGKSIRTGINCEENNSIKVYSFDNYEIEIRLDSDGKFLEIVGVGIKKDFLSVMQKMQKIRSMGYLDLSKKYPDEPDEDDL